MTAADLARYALRELLMTQLDAEPIASAAPGGDDRGGAPVALTVGQRVVEAALHEWECGVHEPRGPEWERIDNYIRDGAGGYWHWLTPYTHNGQVAWCGHFAAWCWARAGLRRAVRQRHVVSTLRLWDWSAANPRRIKPADIQAGDLVVVGPASKPRGSHICVALGAPADGVVETVEGNARGRGPDGSTYEGVIRRTRPLVGAPSEYVIRYAVRPLAGDLTGV